MAGAFELGADRGVGEDFAVIDHPDAAVFVGHGRMAARHVYNAQASMPQVGPMVVIETAIVGTTVTDRGGHPLQDRRSAFGGAGGDKSGDSAHAFSLSHR